MVSLLLCLSLYLSLIPMTAFALDRVSINSFLDAAFRSYVQTNFDRNNDGRLSREERAAVKTIDVCGKNISSLKGIEHFTALTNLNCSNNSLTSLDGSRQCD